MKPGEVISDWINRGLMKLHLFYLIKKQSWGLLRLSTIAKADRILLLEKGALVAQGTFEELSDRLQMNVTPINELL